MARLRPGHWTEVAARVLAVVLLSKGVLWALTSLEPGPWSLRSGLPLYLCDMAVFVAAAACWWRRPILVEVTYFWGLAGVLEAVATPELPARFPRVLFLQYTIGHMAVVAAALFLVVGMRISPRRGAVTRVFAITVAFTAIAGAVDWASGADYMFLAGPPPTFSLLQLFGPWPWYLVGATGLAVLSLLVLDAPFRMARGRAAPDRWRGCARS